MLVKLKTFLENINFDCTTSLRLYNYCSNNPLRYIDPDGEFTVSIGFQGAAGAGSSGAIEGGIKIGFSEEGFSSGLYKSISIGSEFGVSSFAGISISVDLFSNGVKTEKSQSFIVGGSYDKFMGLGLDVAYDLNSKDFSLSASKGIKGGAFKIGFADAPSVGEIHFLYNTTETIETHDIYIQYIEPYLIKGAIEIKKLEYNIVDYIFQNILKGY